MFLLVDAMNLPVFCVSFDMIMMMVMNFSEGFSPVKYAQIHLFGLCMFSLSLYISLSGYFFFLF